MMANAKTMREFISADRDNSFKAELLSYDEKKNKVSVKTIDGELLSFPISKLSEEDQKYVRELGAKLAIAQNLYIQIKEVQGDVDTFKDKVARTHTQDFSYKIQLNTLNSTAEGIKLRYTIFYEKGQLDAKSIPKAISGILDVPLVTDKGSTFVSTRHVSLENVRKFATVAKNKKKGNKGSKG